MGYTTDKFIGYTTDKFMGYTTDKFMGYTTDKFMGYTTDKFMGYTSDNLFKLYYCLLLVCSNAFCIKELPTIHTIFIPKKY
jgi:hypothetical protein